MGSSERGRHPRLASVLVSVLFASIVAAGGCSANRQDRAAQAPSDQESHARICVEVGQIQVTSDRGDESTVLEPVVVKARRRTARR